MTIQSPDGNKGADGPSRRLDDTAIDLDDLERRFSLAWPDDDYPTMPPTYGEIRTLIRLSRAKEEVERAYREVVESARDVAVLGVLPHDYQEDISNDAADARQQRLVDALAALPKETPSS